MQYEGMTYRQLDRRWYELQRARELATGTAEYADYQVEMDIVWARMAAAEASWSTPERRARAQVIGAGNGSSRK